MCIYNLLLSYHGMIYCDISWNVINKVCLWVLSVAIVFYVCQYGQIDLDISLLPYESCKSTFRSHLRYVHTCAERTWAEAGRKLASTQIITCVHTYTVAERRLGESKIRSARIGSNTQFSASASKPRAPNHLCPQEKADPPASLRVCVNIPASAERECQNPPVSTPQPLRACVNVA